MVCQSSNDKFAEREEREEREKQWRKEGKRFKKVERKFQDFSTLISIMLYNGKHFFAIRTSGFYDMNAILNKM